MSAKLHRNPPFRAEHLGSLKRPQNLLDARYKQKASEQELAKLEDQAIKDIVKIQLDLGYRAISDGEYRRHMFWGSFFPGLEGFEEIQDPPLEAFRPYAPDVGAFLEAGHKPGESVFCTGKIKHVGSTYVDQFNYVKNLVPKERQGDVKLTLAAPNWYHLRYRTGKAYPKEVYANDAEYFADIAKAYQEELRILYENGCRNVQFDDPNLAYFCSEKMLAGFKAEGEDADALFDAYIKLYNDCLATRPADFHVGVHLCRGNFVGSRHFAEGAYDRIAVKLFQDLHVDSYYLEYDTARSGGFEPLKHLPKHKNVILGVVTSKFPELENLEEMKAKVFQAADFVAQGTGQTREQALNQLGVSPQCGFASHAEGNLVTIDDMIAKLKLVRQLADAVWPGQP